MEHICFTERAIECAAGFVDAQGKDVGQGDVVGDNKEPSPTHRCRRQGREEICEVSAQKTGVNDLKHVAGQRRAGGVECTYICDNARCSSKLVAQNEWANLGKVSIVGKS